jgi:enhancing lycopene biosynthesis protein 2
MVRVGVLLSGCGVFDGAEIHESVITLLALDRAGAEVTCMAPNVDQLHVIDHTTGEVTGERRNVLVEASRISRGAIRDVAEVGADELDALVIPGGFGAAKNLCDFAVSGSDATVQPDVLRLIGDVVRAEKPIGALCISPALMAAVLREAGLACELTIGNDAETAGALEAMGVTHMPCAVDDIHVDEARQLVTTPAYMLAGRISEAAAGIEKLVRKVLEMAARTSSVAS